MLFSYVMLCFRIVIDIALPRWIECMSCALVKISQKYFDMASNNTLANNNGKLSSDRFLSSTDDDLEKFLGAEETKTTRKKTDSDIALELLLVRCLYNKQKNTWSLVDMEFLISYSTGYLTRSLRSLVRYRVQHSKRNSVSTGAHVLFSISAIGRTLEYTWAARRYEICYSLQIKARQTTHNYLQQSTIYL